jgi:hypothetical protein
VPVEHPAAQCVRRHAVGDNGARPSGRTSRASRHGLPASRSSSPCSN